MALNVKDNSIRLVYVIICVLITLGLAISYSSIIGDVNRYNTYSYIGTALTIIGLIVAIFEVVHSLIVTREIRTQAEVRLNNFKRNQGIAQINECIDTINFVNDSIISDDYFMALKYFQFFRKFYRKLYINYKPHNLKLDITDPRFDNIECSLLSAGKASQQNPLSKSQKKSILEETLQLKALIENNTDFEGKEDVTN